MFYTPPLAASILAGIIRMCAAELERDLGEVREETIARETLYLADEMFFVGMAVKVTPIRSIDGLLVGEGRHGPLTAHLQEHFFGIATGKMEDRFGWMALVEED